MDNDNNKLRRVNIPVPSGRVVLQCQEREGVLHVATVVCNNTLLKLGGFPDIKLLNQPHMTVDSLEICLRDEEFHFVVDEEPTMSAVSVMDFLRAFKNIMAAIAMDIVDKFDILSKATSATDADNKLYACLAMEWQTTPENIDSGIWR